MRGIIALLGLGLVLAGSAGLGAEHTKDSLETVRKKVAEKKAVLLDVREQEEWDEGHLRDARLLPLSALGEKLDAARLAKVLPKGQVVYVHCRSGRRCLRAAEVLSRQGYDVRPLKAGFEELLKAGFPRAEK